MKWQWAKRSVGVCELHHSASMLPCWFSLRHKWSNIRWRPKTPICKWGRASWRLSSAETWRSAWSSEGRGSRRWSPQPWRWGGGGGCWRGWEQHRRSGLWSRRGDRWWRSQGQRCSQPVWYLRFVCCFLSAFTFWIALSLSVSFSPAFFIFLFF